MPYTEDSSKLPSYVKNKPKEVIKKWVALFNDIYEKEGEEAAYIVANSWLKRHLNSKAKLVKRSFIPLEQDKSGQTLIKRSADGEEYVSFVLNGLLPHGDNKRFSESMLRKWEQKINEGEIVIGDIDHEYYDKVAAVMTDEQVKDALKQKPGIAKAVKAIYEKGRLWVKALIDKRYRKIIERSKGVSVEALCSFADDLAEDGDILGFSFNVNTDPADPEARVYND